MKLSKKNIDILKHALFHLEENAIHNGKTLSGWYCGDKYKFIETHIDAIKNITDWIEKKEIGEDD